jgi:enoyl-CoA hydratase/carnithine racemase
MSHPPEIALPDSYAALKRDTIRFSHYPESSPTVTPIIVLTLYRPGRHNAFTLTMGQELVQAFQMFDVDDRVKAIVVTGDGRIYCAGADLERGFEKSQERTTEHRDG